VQGQWEVAGGFSFHRRPLRPGWAGRPAAGAIGQNAVKGKWSGTVKGERGGQRGRCGGQPWRRGPDGGNKQRPRGLKGGAPGWRTWLC